MRMYMLYKILYNDMYLLIVTSPENAMQAGEFIWHHYIITLDTVPKMYSIKAWEYHYKLSPNSGS